MAARIALIGDFGSGKTTIAQAWCDIVGGVKLSFAEALKWEVAYTLAHADDDMSLVDYYYDQMLSPITKDKYRTLLQWWGTEYRRAQDPEYWLKKMQGSLLIAKDKPIAIDDCRFDNELKLLRSEGFRIIRLESGATVRPQTNEQQGHASEQDWKHWSVDTVLPFELGPEVQAQKLVDMGYAG